MDVARWVEGVWVRVADRVVMNSEAVGQENGACGDDMVLIVERGGSKSLDGEWFAGTEAEDLFDGGAALMNLSERTDTPEPDGGEGFVC